MTILLISTTRRHTPANEISGKLISFDLAAKAVIRESEIIEPPFRDLNPNPRGGIRGLKGISVSGELLAIANSSSIFVYDRIWNLVANIEHPSIAGIHDIFFSGDEIWVSSARNDVIARIDLSGTIRELIDIRTLGAYKNASAKSSTSMQSKADFISGKINFRDPTTHDEAGADSAHVNSVYLGADGNLYFSCGLIRSTDHIRLVRWKSMLARFGILNPILKLNDFVISKIVQKAKKNKNETIAKPFSGKSLFLKKTKDGEVIKILELTGVSVPSHSIRYLSGDEFAYLKTNEGTILILEGSTGKLRNQFKVGNNFLRGFTKLNDDICVAGDGNEIVVLNFGTGEIISRHEISTDKNENVFDIFVLPDGFSLPPVNFNTVKDSFGFVQEPIH